MKNFTVYALLVALALSQSLVLSTPCPITESTSLDVIADTPFVTQDLSRLDEVVKREEASHALEKEEAIASV